MWISVDDIDTVLTFLHGVFPSSGVATHSSPRTDNSQEENTRMKAQ
jgi:hypothetical protein